MTRALGEAKIQSMRIHDGGSQRPFGQPPPLTASRSLLPVIEQYASSRSLKSPSRMTGTPVRFSLLASSAWMAMASSR